MDNSTFVTGRKLDADRLVILFHYSHYIPTNIQYCVTQYINGKAIAAIYYSIPATRWSDEVLELCRLVRSEETDNKPTLTQIISKSVNHIRQDNKYNLIVSFADSTHNHHGGIYQAASWNYHKLRKSCIDAFVIDGILVPRRTCNHRYGTSGLKLVKQLEEEGHVCTPHRDKGKHIYWKALNRKGEQKAQKLGLTAEEYPKPDRV